MTESSSQPASNDPDAIRSDIDQTRTELADTVDELSGKLNIKAQAGDKVTAAKGKIVDRAAKAKASAPPQVQRAMTKVSERATPIAHQVGDKAAPHRSKVMAAGAGAVVLLLAVRRSRRGGDT